MLVCETEKVQSWETNFVMCDSRYNLLPISLPGIGRISPPSYLPKGFVMSSYLIATLDLESGRLFALA